ncbi:MAG: hypothetical protein ABIH79_00805 [archaeon]
MELEKINRGQMQIQQMAFMILAVFLFFILVGLFFLRIQLGDVTKSVVQLQTEQAISSLKVIADMPELNYDSHESLSLDEDKLRIMSGNFGSHYSEFWSVASVKVYKIYPKFDELVECPSLNCNYFEIYESSQESVKTYSTYVSICKRIEEIGYVYDKCEIGKLVVGVISK